MTESSQTPPFGTPAVRAAVGVIEAALAHSPGTAYDIAYAEQSAGILYDPQVIEDMRTEVRAQVRAEYEAELAERGEQLAVMANLKHRWDQVARLLEGRPHTDAMLVGEILAAADGHHPRAEMPLDLRWAQSVEHASTDRSGGARVPCTTSHGAPALLTLDRVERAALAYLLDIEVRDIHAPCPTPGCGTDRDLDPADAWGWTRLQVAGVDGPARWYCTPMCVSNALARAGEQLAEADHRVELDGGL